MSSEKLSGYDFWQSIGSPHFVLAPMVGVGELPFRLLCNQHGTDLCYTPMINSKQFIISNQFRRDFFQTCKEDRPLIVQFNGDDPEKMLEAAKYVENYCDAIDINFGCPQNIAKSGHYGAYLQDNLSLMSQLVSTLHHNLHIPVTAKFRKQTDIQQTIRIAEMLESSGAQVICIHGRTREQKGMDLGHSDWECIRIVREHVHVPFISNGSILCKEDVVNCLNYTKADAVMCGDALRRNAAFFEGMNEYISKTNEQSSSSSQSLISHPSYTLPSTIQAPFHILKELITYCRRCEGKQQTNEEQEKQEEVVINEEELQKQQQSQQYIQQIQQPIQQYSQQYQILPFTPHNHSYQPFARDECLRMRLQSFESYSDLRNELGEAKSYDELEQIVDQLEERLRSGAEPQPHYQRHKTEFIDQGDLMDGVNLFDEQIPGQ
ncbi:MAG: putative tRNA-dihydrouridine synthase 1 [Streblomastix strix]|uniref:tRNA-dihydrouridine(16/17) synthase [NAD(P)(+)] n=1 Tax=Streblomastix strix TaxID=222440 RepID=A0A5J4X7J0_9EUKA|nr:MAG: putative tRNA-dihydrouridine synthase 1 [Streblomastix strix]